MCVKAPLECPLIYTRGADTVVTCGFLNRQLYLGSRTGSSSVSPPAKVEGWTNDPKDKRSQCVPPGICTVPAKYDDPMLLPSGSHFSMPEEQLCLPGGLKSAH